MKIPAIFSIISFFSIKKEPRKEEANPRNKKIVEKPRTKRREWKRTDTEIPLLAFSSSMEAPVM